MERTVPLERVQRWLGRVTRADAEAKLRGLPLDDGESEDLVAIRGIAWDEASRRPRALLLAAGRRVPMTADAVVVDASGDLEAAIEASASDAERLARARQSERAAFLAGIGIGRPLASVEDEQAVIAMAGMVATGEIPAYPARHSAYLALCRLENPAVARAGARLFRPLLDVSKPPEDGYWRLARLLHLAGELRAAADLAPVLWSGRMRNPRERAVLTVTVVPVLLALADITCGREWYEAAERAARLGYALGPDEASTAMLGAARAALAREGIAPARGGKGK
jgi:hypothetical protein